MDSHEIEWRSMTPRKSGKSGEPEDKAPTSPEAQSSESAPLRKIPTLFENLYELVVAAATRARQINAGSPTPVDEEDSRPLNIALRELADGQTTYELSDGKPQE